MPRLIITVRFHLALFTALAVALPLTAQPHRPKLVVAIVIDQFRYDYLTRFAADYNGGLATMLRGGAVFTNARYDHFPTVTAVGHSIIMTGARPAMSGIIANSWYSREEHRIVTSVCDDAVTTVGRNGDGTETKTGKSSGNALKDCTDYSPASPRRLLVDTLGDELRIASPDSRVVGVSLKPRSAILPAGHMATGAYWFDDSGAFVSSSFYRDTLPSWAAEFNKSAPANAYAGKEWMGTKFGSGPELMKAIPASPWGNELIEAFAEAAIDGEKLGGRGPTDLLTISFSSNDYVGHRVGPDDPAVHDMAIRTDKLLDRFFHFLAARHLGPNDVLVFVSADHGVAPVPEKNLERKLPAGRMSAGDLANAAASALAERYGPGDWLQSKQLDPAIYLNDAIIREKKLDAAEVRRTAAEALRLRPNVFRVYTRDQLASGVTGDRIAQAMTHAFFARRSGDIFVVLDPYWLMSSSGTSHGTPFNYDSHVPLLFMGPGIRPGRYHPNVSVTDIAPTLATILNLEMPAGAEGRVLSEMLNEK